MLMIACNCFGHADECVYNETVATMKLSLNADGFYEGGGVCVGCQVRLQYMLKICLWLSYTQVKLIFLCS